MPPPDPAVYERGDALDDVLPASSDEPPDTASLSPESIGVPEGADDFSEEEYWTWLASLIQNGTELDEHLDDLLEEIYELEPPFYSPTGRRRLRDLLNELHAVRTSVRAFERDVEQLSFAFSRTEKIESVAADNAELVFSSIKRTYDRAYDLCLYKLDRMSDGWITATNILISVTILIVTILFWMEFR